MLPIGLSRYKNASHCHCLSLLRRSLTQETFFPSVSAYGPFGSCDVLSGVAGNYGKFRTSTVQDGACGGDTTCVPGLDSVCCARDCTVTALSAETWTGCGPLAGVVGDYGRSRTTVIAPATCSGNDACNTNSETECCAVDCVEVASDWTDYVYDSVYNWTYGEDEGTLYACGEGNRTRQWGQLEATCGGVNTTCRDDLEIRYNSLCCPTDCVEELGEWGECQALPGQPTCDQGVQTRQPTQEFPTCAGKPCVLDCTGGKETADGTVSLTFRTGSCCSCCSCCSWCPS